MGLRRPGAPKDYEEMPGTNVSIGQDGLGASINSATQHIINQEFELASVTVVPDG